jgi:hypothetical protein
VRLVVAADETECIPEGFSPARTEVDGLAAPDVDVLPLRIGATVPTPQTLRLHEKAGQSSSSIVATDGLAGQQASTELRPKP